eukprot:TRINITY_DN964_c0_g1_i2.p1 TRINITY_DN964_c0_g1~~TRINITY_DN964_c0_g1_i2.p1  ORF type:complete len:686 (+),score=190.24 TRINITY_DN964_c0_g1_i2:88-2145(+)
MDDSPGLMSVTEATDVAEFMQNAMLANKTFEGEKQAYGTSIQPSAGILHEDDPAFTNNAGGQGDSDDSDIPSDYDEDDDVIYDSDGNPYDYYNYNGGGSFEDHYGGHGMQVIGAQGAPTVPRPVDADGLTAEDVLVVPRRPAWDSTTTKEQLKEQEQSSFLTWRRKLARFEEAHLDLVITPFEKNLEVWRQLWRVLERSDMVCQIIDCRNPLVFRCEDLEKYIREIDSRKRVMLLINKADLLPRSYRLAWTKYFQEAGVEFKFFSAGEEQAKLNDVLDEQMEAERAAQAAAKAHRLPGQDSDSDSDEEEKGEGEGEREREGEGEGQEDKQGEEETVPEENEVDVKGPFPPDHVYTREQLLYTFSQLVADPDRYNAGRRDRVTIGFVGFPNVGKSSTINVLYGKKRVAVGATPGKTKHFQTLLVGDDIELCDCPGLVFPSTATTKAEMTCNGVLPIDQMRDHRGPIDHLARIVPRTVFEVTYGITLPRPHQDEDASRPPSVEEVTFTLARNRGFMTNAGPDGSRAARLILKDYVNGKLLHCHPPPGFTPSAEDMPVPHAAASAGGGAETTSGDQHSIDVTELREMQHAGKTLKVNKIYANQVAEGGLSIEEALGNNNVYDTKSGASLAGRKGGKRRLKGGKKTKKGQGDAMFTRVTNTHFTPVPRQQLQAMLKQGKGKGKGAGAVQ